MKTINLIVILSISALLLVAIAVIVNLLLRQQKIILAIQSLSAFYKKYKDVDLFESEASKVLNDSRSIVYVLWGKKLDTLYMKNKPYLKPKVTLEDVAKLLGTNRTYVSNIVNKSDMNFSDYNNVCRIKEFIVNYLQNPDISFEELYMQSGFASYATFCKMFCRYVGQTPNKWAKENKHLRRSPKNEEQ